MAIRSVFTGRPRVRPAKYPNPREGELFTPGTILTARHIVDSEVIARLQKHLKEGYPAYVPFARRDEEGEPVAVMHPAEKSPPKDNEAMATEGPTRDEMHAKIDLSAEKLRGEMAGLRVEFADFRTEIKNGMADMRVEVANLRSEMHKGFGELQKGFVEIHKQNADNFKWLIGMMFTAAALAVGVATYIQKASERPAPAAATAPVQAPSK